MTRLLSMCVRNLKPFRLREQKSFPNLSDTLSSLIYLVFSTRTVTYRSSFFPRRFIAHACLGHKSEGKKESVRNLQYRSGTRLVRGMSAFYTCSAVHSPQSAKTVPRLRKGTGASFKFKWNDTLKDHESNHLTKFDAFRMNTERPS